MQLFNFLVLFYLTIFTKCHPVTVKPISYITEIKHLEPHVISVEVIEGDGSDEDGEHQIVYGGTLEASDDSLGDLVANIDETDGNGQLYSHEIHHDDVVEHKGDAGGNADGGDHHHHVDHHKHPKYKFEYGVKDEHTGDKKTQWESRDGDKVKGGYTLNDSDGTKRVVEYTSDKHKGFHAVVKRIGHAIHPDKHGHGYAESYANVQHHH